ncbi:MAG: pbpD 1, partial [Verrucomicrobiales bacterium]|nr:pbpD 1 [Verrucomicrobiales bacterium]
WQGRSWTRKGLEAYYSVWMEILLSKKRILELYVNVIELGDGIYGLEAAAQHYFHKSARDLTDEESAALVMIMPRPRVWNPLKPDETMLKRKAVIFERAKRVTFPLVQQR